AAKQTGDKPAGGKPAGGKPGNMAASASPTVSKRVTPPKNRPTPSGSSARPASTGKAPRTRDARPKKK
ncbi:MAG: hypothetical protein ACXVH5_06705, partial [Ilumatobacteraceae bacterium]